MAKKSSNAKKDGSVAAVEVSPDKIKSLWKGIGKQDWMNILQQAHPDNKWTFTNDGIQGCCPFHGENTPSFKINFNRRQAKCFGGCGAYYWNAVQFYADISSPKKTYSEALLDIKTTYNPPGFPQRVVKRLTHLDAHRRMKALLHAVTNTVLVDSVALHATDPDYAFAKNTVLFLKNRGLPLVYEKLPIGILPPLLLLEQAALAYCKKHSIDVTLIEAMREYMEPAYKDTMWIGSLILYYGSSPEHVSRVKLRQPPAPQVPGAFTPLQTPKKNIMYIADDDEDSLGVFGLYGVSAYKFLLASKAAKRFYVVEGEFDALSLLANQIDRVQHDIIVVAAGGSGHSGMDLMKSFGFEEVCAVGDDDDPGAHFVQEILQKTHLLAARVFLWPQSIKSIDPAKDTTDPDEAVAQHGYDKVRAALLDDENFQLPHTWAIACAGVEISDIDLDDVRQLTSVAASWGLYVTNVAERHQYVSRISKKYDIDPGPLWGLILNDDDSDTAFIKRISDTILRKFTILESSFENNRWVYRCWHGKSKKIVNLPIADSRLLRSAVESAEGKDLVRFIHEDVGEPGFKVTPFADEEDPVYLERLEEYSKYLVPAVSNLGEQSPATDNAYYVSTGCHAMKPKDASAPDADLKLYLVNGTTLYKGLFPTENGDKVVWSACDGPRDGDVYMRITQNNVPRMVHTQCKDSSWLNERPKLTIEEMYDKIHDVIDTGWDFKNHDTTVDLLTAFILLLPISDVVERQPLIMFTGDQSSGKTSLIGGLIGGDALPQLNIVQNALYMSNFTQAGVRQSMDCSSVCLCLDEFEDKGNDKVSVRIRDVLSMIRGMANNAAITRYGSVTGKSILTRLRHCVVLGGIRGLKDPADLSRFIRIEMDRKLTRASPLTSIIDKFGHGVLTQIREDLPRLMYNEAYRVFKAHDEIQHTYRHGENLPKDINLTRTRGMFYGLMAIMKLAGKDYNHFIQRYFKDFRLVLERLSRVSVSNDLYNEVFYSPVIPMPSPTGNGNELMSVNRILREGKGDLMNSKNIGLYYSEDRRWLVVHWPTAAPCILPRSNQFQNATPGYLKDQAARSPYHVKYDSIMRSKILEEEEVTTYLGDTQIVHISVYDVQAFVKDSARVNKGTVKAVKGREVTYLTDDPRFKLALADKTFPKPPPVKEDVVVKEEEGSYDY